MTRGAGACPTMRCAPCSHRPWLRWNGCAISATPTVTVCSNMSTRPGTGSRIKAGKIAATRCSGWTVRSAKDRSRSAKCRRTRSRRRRTAQICSTISGWTGRMPGAPGPTVCARVFTPRSGSIRPTAPTPLSRSMLRSEPSTRSPATSDTCSARGYSTIGSPRSSPDGWLRPTCRPVSACAP